MSRPLWHYTCEHARAKIGDSGTLLPLRHLIGRDDLPRLPVLVRVRAGLVWLTDLETTDRRALGFITMNGCNPVAHRYRAADDTPATPFQQWLRTLSPGMRREVLLTYVYDVHGARPAHWYVVAEPVPVVLDEVKS